MRLIFVGLFASASCMQHAAPNSQIDLAFKAAYKQQLSQAIMQRQASQLQSEVNRLAHPDVPLQLVFRGVARPAIIPGSATTDALHPLATRLHKLSGRQALEFFLNGAVLPLGVPVSESPLANTENLEVHVRAAQSAAVMGAGACTESRSSLNRAAPPRRTAAMGALERARQARELGLGVDGSLGGGLSIGGS